MVTLVFFFSLFMILYVYLAYPLLVSLIALVRKKNVKKAAFEPHVTILIAAHNEAESIESTIRNKLGLDYPTKKLEVIVISDGSMDSTDQIVKQYKSQGVRLIRQNPRAGKTSALNLAVPEAKGEILVFSDANSMYAKDAVRHLMRNFSDPNVGYVTGNMIYTDTGGNPLGHGCTAYMRYENFLRKAETRVGSVVGVDGGIDAVRKKLYTPMNPDQLPDFVLPLKVIEQGSRVVYEPNAVLQEPSLSSAKDEYQMRVRVSLRSLWALRDMRHLLTFSPSVLFSWQLWSHKALRYICFIFLIGGYLSNLALWQQGYFYKFFFLLQNAAYLGAIVSPFLEKRGRHLRALYLLNYFVLLNLSAAHAFIKFLLGQKQVTWTPRKG